MASADRVFGRSLLLDQNLSSGTHGHPLHLHRSLDNNTVPAAFSSLSSSSIASADTTIAPPPRRLIPRSREVPSRYKTAPNAASPTFRHRLSSPTFHRVGFCPDNDVPSPTRSLSSERRRPTPPVALLEARTSFTASFDGEAMASKRMAGCSEITHRWPSRKDSAADLSGAEKCSNVSCTKSKGLRTGEKPASSCLIPCDPSLRPAPNLIQRSVGTFEKPSVRGKERTLYRRQSSENARPSENLPSKPDRTSSTCRKLLGAALSKSLDLNRDGNTYKHPSSTTCKLPRSSADSSGVFNRSINRSTASCGAVHNLISDHSINGSIASCVSQCRRAARKLTLENGRGDKKYPEKIQSKMASTIDNLRDSGLSRTEHGLRHVRHDTGEEAQPACLGARLQEIDFTSAASSSPLRELVATGSSATITTMRGTLPIPFSAEPAQFSSRRLRNRNSTNTCILQRSLSSIDQKLLFEPRGEQPCLWSSTLPRTLSCAHKLPQHSLSPPEPKPSNSPTRTWHSVSGSQSSMLYSLGSSDVESAADVYFGGFKGRRKIRVSQMEETFLQRVLHNRLLQWCFVNAQADHVVNMQRATGEKMLFGVSTTLGELRNSITRKRIRLQRTHHMQTLDSTLKVQGPRLEDWFFLHQDHMNALLGLVEALEASILKVPVHKGVKADTPAIQQVMGSSIDVLFAVKSSLDFLQPKVEVANTLLTELAQVANRERTLLKECEHLLVTASNLEVEERSLRMHLVQAGQEKARLLGPLLAAAETLVEDASLSS